MCGRFTLTTPVERLAEQFDISGELPALAPSYNIAPTQKIAAVAANAEGERKLGRLQWGLVPRWSKDPEIGSKMINARAETVFEKNSFKSAFKKRRCLIPADGFYEWRRPGEGESGPKQPYYIRLETGTPYAFAGLWETWEGEDGRKIHSTTIITTEANELMSGIHHRMPVILSPQSYATWLDTSIQEPEGLMPLLAAYPSERMEAHPVSTHVNRPANDDPGCIETVGGGDEPGSLWVSQICTAPLVDSSSARHAAVTAVVEIGTRYLLSEAKDHRRIAIACQGGGSHSHLQSPTQL